MTNPTSSEVRERVKWEYDSWGSTTTTQMLESYADLLSTMEKTEPAGYLYTLHMEDGQTSSLYTKVDENPFGKCGEDYSHEYHVTSKPMFFHPTISTEQATRPAADGDLVKYHPAPNAASPMVPSSPTHNLQVIGSKMRDEIAAIIRLADGESVAQGYVTKVGSGYTKPNLPVGSWENRALLAEELCRAYKIQIDLLAAQPRAVPFIETAPFYWTHGGDVKQDTDTAYCVGWNDCRNAMIRTTPSDPLAVSQDAEG
jgi:hypothetical protein